jgi:hypothetical protein
MLMDISMFGLGSSWRGLPSKGPSHKTRAGSLEQLDSVALK